jgi:ribosomal protein S18 acetylase RimI-like enzyme
MATATRIRRASEQDAKALAAFAALGADLLWLGVWQENPRAVAFYKKCGFAQIAEKTFKLGTEVQQDFVMCHELGAVA